MNQNSLKHFLLRGLLTLVIFFVPLSTEAQTSEAEYRANLLALIELLQKQIAALQAEATNIEPVIVSTDSFESFIFDDTRNLQARYLLDNPLSVSSIENDTHRKFFTRFFDLVPDEYDRFFIDLVVYEEQASDFEGFVETVPPYRPDTWRLGINEMMFEFKENSRATNELFVHEFSHVVSYQGIPGRTEPANATCHEIFAELGCPPDNAYLTDFIEEFWSDRELDELMEAKEGELIWTNQEVRDNFVSEYASTDPAEDFAESFTVFVLAARPTGASVPEEKVSYFYQFDELVDLRSDIRAEL
jgi:hypothetical protein